MLPLQGKKFTDSKEFVHFSAKKVLKKIHKVHKTKSAGMLLKLPDALIFQNDEPIKYEKIKNLTLFLFHQQRTKTREKLKNWTTFF